MCYKSVGRRTLWIQVYKPLAVPKGTDVCMHVCMHVQVFFDVHVRVHTHFTACLITTDETFARGVYVNNAMSRTYFGQLGAQGSTRKSYAQLWPSLKWCTAVHFGTWRLHSADTVRRRRSKSLDPPSVISLGTLFTFHSNTTNTKRN